MSKLHGDDTIKHKVDLKNWRKPIPNELDGMIKEEMTTKEIQALGIVILLHKIDRIKKKIKKILFGEKHERKIKKNND
jgi:hypothetical protein